MSENEDVDTFGFVKKDLKPMKESIKGFSVKQENALFKVLLDGRLLDMICQQDGLVYYLAVKIAELQKIVDLMNECRVWEAPMNMLALDPAKVADWKVKADKFDAIMKIMKE